MEATAAKFETGKTYATASICDSECIFSMTVIRRTAKTLVVNVDSWGEKRLRVTVIDGVETVMPLGRYSMAPVITAEKLVEQSADEEQEKTGPVVETSTVGGKDYHQTEARGVTYWITKDNHGRGWEVSSRRNSLSRMSVPTVRYFPTLHDLGESVKALRGIGFAIGAA